MNQVWFSFRWRKYGGVRCWFIHRNFVAPDGSWKGMRIEGGSDARLEFASKGEARRWAQARAALERVEYREYKKPRRPAPVAATPLETARARVNIHDRVATHRMEAGELLEALHCIMKSAEGCLALVQHEPAHREKLNAAARSRVKVARQIFDEWEKSLAIPPPLLTLLS